MSLGVFPMTCVDGEGAAGSVVDPEAKPTREQLKRLRQLAQETGESFGYPANAAEAEAEIARMEGRPVSSGIEEWMDRVPVRSRVARGVRDGAAVRGSEVVGYGSSCRYRHSQR
jgi:hypothetical protein